MEILKLEERLAAARKDWESSRGREAKDVHAEDIAQVVSHWTGIPVARMVETEADKLARMEENLHRRIVGQEDAVRAVSDAIRRNRAGITSARRPIGFVQSATPSYAEARDLVLHEVKRFFKPEFLNRLDDVIVFHYLEPKDVRAIAAMFVDELVQRLAATRKAEIVVDDTVLDKLAADGFDPVYGARPLRREVERQLENPLAMRIVTGKCPDGSRVRVQVREAQIAFAIGG